MRLTSPIQLVLFLCAASFLVFSVALSSPTFPTTRTAVLVSKRDSTPSTDVSAADLTLTNNNAPETTLTDKSKTNVQADSKAGAQTALPAPPTSLNSQTSSTSLNVTAPPEKDVSPSQMTTEAGAESKQIPLSPSNTTASGSLLTAGNTTTPSPNKAAQAIVSPVESAGGVSSVPSPPNVTAADSTMTLTKGDHAGVSNITSVLANATAIPEPAHGKGKDKVLPATSAGETTFPAYGDYQGNVSSSTYHPFLAEVDTLFSSEPMREYGPAPYETRYRAMDDSNGRFDVLKHWANLAPYFSSPLYPKMQQYKALPAHCKLKQVHLLHRHGARLPTDDPIEAAPHFGQFISNLTLSNTTFSFDGPLNFLNDWTYDLGANLLTPAGSQQLYDSGVQSYYRYSALYNSTEQKHKPVVRTTSQSRMIDSATYFNLGFFGKNAPKLVDLEVLIESDDFNSTLSAGESCANAENFHLGEPKVKEWMEKYLKSTMQRFQKHVSGFNLTPKLIFGMQALCAYETYAVGMSDFCPLFNKAEWEGFEYAMDLHYSWNYGFASPTGRAQGVGWGQEFMARLKGANFTGPVTSQNMTLDSDPISFPTDQRFYFDFSHDSLMVSVLAALNFTQFDARLDATKLDSKRNFVSSHLVPFGARLFFEVLACHTEGEKQHYIRAILNDALLPLSHGQGCPASSLKDGLCPLDKFISHFEKNAIEAADYQNMCFGNASEPAPTAVATSKNNSNGGPASDSKATAVDAKAPPAVKAH